MRSLILLLVLLRGGCWASVSAAVEPRVLSHTVVYGEEGKFGGWPANHGMWNWGDELLVGFSIGTHRDLGERHNIDRDMPEYHVLARSLDGGDTWSLERPDQRGMLINEGGMRHGTTDPSQTEPAPRPLEEPIEFDHPDFCMTLRFQNVDGGRSRLYYSYDRGHNWQGPYEAPMLGQSGIMARTDYVVNGPHDCHVMLTASKSNGEEGRVVCGQTTDGGQTWQLLGYVGPEPVGFSIMPSTVRLGAQTLLTTTRRREGEDEPEHRWIDVWKSADNGKNWNYVGDGVDDLGAGNPPSLIKLRDGRLCLTYGVRKPPYSIEARFSDDEGKSWGEPLVLKTGGGGRDLGYVRSLERPDGRIVTVYYFEPAESPYRQIIATLWDAGLAEE